MNKEVMFSSKTDLWSTPQDFYDKLNEEFHFETDVCALPENAKCAHYYTPEEDGLAQEWEGVCWCNPPYGREIGKWVEKAAKSSKATVVMLLPARTDTRWFHDWIYEKAEIRFIKGRLKFGGQKNAAPFPSMVVIFERNLTPHREVRCPVCGSPNGRFYEATESALLYCEKCGNKEVFFWPMNNYKDNPDYNEWLKRRGIWIET